MVMSMRAKVFASMVLDGLTALAMLGTALALAAPQSRAGMLGRVPNIPYSPALVLRSVLAKDVLPPEEFWFVVWGDSKVAGRPERDRAMETMLKTILAARPLPVLAFECGDVVSGDGTSEEDWISFERCGRGLFRKFRAVVSYWPTIGDHEDRTGWGGKHYLEFFDLPEVRAEDYGFAPRFNAILVEKCWSFNYKNCHFASFNSMAKEGSRGEKVIMKWLEQDLRRNRKKWVFVFTHRPVTENYTKDYLPLLERFRVTALFAGHVHEYRRFKRKPGTWCTYITQGSCTNPNHGESRPDSVVATREKSFTRVHVLADCCVGETVTIDGKKVLDRFILKPRKLRK